MAPGRPSLSITYGNGSYLGECIVVDGTPVEDGRGTFTWSNGDRYEGDFVRGVRSGRGIFFWSDGRRYEGGFLDDVRSGDGTMRWNDGTVYEGGFSEGLMSGRGRLVWPSGEWYEGDFLEGRMDGRGVHHAADGTPIYEGDWVANCPVNRGGWDTEDGA